MSTNLEIRTDLNGEENLTVEYLPRLVNELADDGLVFVPNCVCTFSKRF